jgi:hypothetical protein
MTHIAQGMKWEGEAMVGSFKQNNKRGLRSAWVSHSRRRKASNNCGRNLKSPMIIKTPNFRKKQIVFSLPG